MINRWWQELRRMSVLDLIRMLTFDILAPLATIAGLLMVGLVLAWPKWWVAVCAVLVLLIVEGMLFDLWRQRGDGTTTGTEENRALLRLVAVTLCTAALVAAGVVGYQNWTQPDRERKSDKTEVVRIAAEVAEATATVTPLNPAASIDRAAKLFAPERVEAFKEKFGRAANDQALVGVSVEAKMVGAGVEGITPSAASVMVILHGVRSAGDQPPRAAPVAARVKLTKRGDRWLVLDVSPIHGR